MVVTLLALSSLTAVLASDPVGTYMPDLSALPGGSKNTLSRFIPGQIRVNRDGTYFMAGSNIEGFWRLHGTTLIFTSPTFLGIKAPIPDAIVRKSWPNSIGEGMVWRPASGGTWAMQDFAGFKGTARFNRVKLSTTELLKRNEDVESDDGMVAFITLRNEASDRLKDLEREALTGKDNYWPLVFMTTGGSRGRQLALRLIATGKVPQKHRAMRNLAPQLEGAEALATLSQSDDAKILHPLVVRLGELRYTQAIPTVRRYIGSSDLKLSVASTVALARMDDQLTLAQAARFALEEPKELEKKDLFDLLAYLVRNHPASRALAIKRLLAESLSKEDNGMFGGLYASYAAESLAHTRQPETVPYLLAVLENAHYLRARGAAARALGKLRAREAVPALLGAKASFPLSDQIDGFYNAFYLRYDLAEALYEIEHGPDPHPRKLN